VLRPANFAILDFSITAHMCLEYRVVRAVLADNKWNS
jgi:hypothetical protein